MVSSSEDSDSSADEEQTMEQTNAKAKTKAKAKSGKGEGAGKGKAKVTKEEEEEEEDYSEEDSDDDDEEEILVTGGKRQPLESGNGSKASSKNKQENREKKKKNKNDDIEVDFEFCDPKEDDFMMIKTLLLQGTLGNMIAKDVSGLSDDICEQGACGTTVCVDGDVYCFASVLSSKTFGNKPYFQSLKKILLRECPESLKKQLQGILKKGTGLMISERIVNVPNEIIPVLHQNVVDDLEWAKENVKETGGTKEMFNYDNILFIAPCHSKQELEEMSNVEDFDSDMDDEDEDEDGDDNNNDNEDDDGSKKKRKSSSSSKSTRSKKKNNKKTKMSEKLSDYQTLHFEQQVLLEKSSLTFKIPLIQQNVMQGKARGAVPRRFRPKVAFVGIIPVKTHQTIRKHMTKLLE